MVKFCPNCGNKIDSDEMKYCDECGSPLTVENRNNSMNTHVVASMNKDYKHLIIIGYVAIFLISIGFGLIGCIIAEVIGLCLGLYLLTRKDKNIYLHGLLLIAIPIIIAILWFILAVVLVAADPYYYY